MWGLDTTLTRLQLLARAKPGLHGVNIPGDDSLQVDDLQHSCWSWRLKCAARVRTSKVPGKRHSPAPASQEMPSFAALSAAAYQTVSGSGSFHNSIAINQFWHNKAIWQLTTWRYMENRVQLSSIWPEGVRPENPSLEASPEGVNFEFWAKLWKWNICEQHVDVMSSRCQRHLHGNGSRTSNSSFNFPLKQIVRSTSTGLWRHSPS